MNNSQEKLTSPNLIDSVPGIERSEPAANATQEGKVIPYAEGQFRGDPRRVIGHPLNPFNEALQAYSDKLKEQEKESALREAAGSTAVRASGIITEIPPEIRPSNPS